MNDSRLENKIKRQDNKRRKRYKPITTGLPKGFSKSQWFLRKKKECKFNTPSFIFNKYITHYKKTLDF